MRRIESILENEEKSSLGFWDTNRLCNTSQKPVPPSKKKKKINKKNCYLVPVNHSEKIRESEKIDKAVENEGDSNTSRCWSTCNDPRMPGN